MPGQLAEPAVAGPTTGERGTARPAAAPRLRRGRRLLIAGAVVIALAAIFRLAIVPSLLKLPTSLDVTARYSGEQFVYVDPATGAPLADPQRAPLEITRHITADKHESDGHRIVLDEAMTASVQGAAPLRQRNRYVMDRESAVNLGDARSYAFAPTNKVNRSGDYRLAFGFDVAEGQPISLYSNDTDSTYTAVPDAREPAVTVHGNRALVYDARQRPHALAPAYLAGLEQAVGLPATTTLKALSSGLERAGVDLSAVVAALPRADQERVAQLQGKAIPLIYEESLASRAAIEPKTGTLANLVNERVTVTVRPDPKALAPLVAILERNEAIAAVRSAQPKLRAASTHAQPVFALDYHQTPASVNDTGHDISAASMQLSVAKLWLPLMLVALGLGLACARSAPSTAHRIAHLHWRRCGWATLIRPSRSASPGWGPAWLPEASGLGRHAGAYRSAREPSADRRVIGKGRAVSDDAGLAKTIAVR